MSWKAAIRRTGARLRTKLDYITVIRKPNVGRIILRFKYFKF